ncbi:MAG: amidohydrolase family protein [Eubacteriaceae bacterium]|nr:amidohydrolase family protein [Eubacteriaceae bacterium]
MIANSNEQMSAIVNARIFDGVNIISGSNRAVLIKGRYIEAVTDKLPEKTRIIDAKGATLIPGLIDSHVHTDIGGLCDALKFGVTTELEMMGRWTKKQREQIAGRDDIADLRSPGMGATPKGGHPTEYASQSLLNRLFVRYLFPFVQTPRQAVKFVNKQISSGADYIKIFIEDGSCIGYPGLAELDDATIRAAIDEAHRHNKLTIAHVTTADATHRAISAGIDGLGHLFFDCNSNPALIERIAKSGVFVIPTTVTLSSAFGNTAADLAADSRVSSKLSKEWLSSLSRSMNVYPKGKLENAFAAIKALHSCGVDILAGSDVSEPTPELGGLAHGASLHHELQLLAAAGLKPIEALRCAAFTPAKRFALSDRGSISAGKLADLVLIEGNPMDCISDTLSIRTVWRHGAVLQAQ